MSAEKAHLLGLIGLRALAERDPIEYRRVADLSKRELDRRIASLLRSVSDSECDELYRTTVELTGRFESLSEADMLLKQVYLTSIYKAQQESIHTALKATELSHPSAIVVKEVARADLTWSSTDEMELQAILGPIDAEFAHGDDPDNLVDCLGVLVGDLADEDVLIGSDSSKEVAIWRICATILGMRDIQISTKTSSEDLWNAAKKKKATEWLTTNTAQTPKPPRKSTRSKRKQAK